MLVCEICGKTFERHFGAGNLTEGGMAFKCPECSAKSLDSTPRADDEPGRDEADFARELKQLAPARPVVTWALVAACGAVFALELARGAGFDSMPTALAIQLGADYGPLTLTGQWWRLLTSMFLHFGAIHLVFNMWCLWALGSLAERLMGQGAFLLLYFATGLAAGLLSLAVHPEIVSAGASGAVFGITGGLVTYLWLKKAPIDFAKVKKQLSSLGFFLAYNVFYSLRPGVDMMAHAGGLVAGLAIGAALPRFLEPAAATAIASPIHELGAGTRRVARVGIACVAVLLVGAAAVRHLQSDAAYIMASLEQIDAGHSADVLPALEQIVKRQPKSAMAHFALGAAYLRTGRAADAVRELLAADHLQPGSGATQHQLGVAYLVRNDFDNAIIWLGRALASEPDNAFARLGLANALLGKKQYADAAVEARKVLAVMPNDAQGHAVLGVAEFQLGQLDEGIQELETAVRLDPNDSDFRARLRGAYLAVGRPDKIRAMQAPKAKQGQNPP